MMNRGGGGHRFTWWNALLFSLYALSNGTLLKGITLMTVIIVVRLEHKLECILSGSRFAKITGVLIMSFIGCGLLEEALDDMGAAGYFFGTFIVHYLPGKYYLTLG